MITGAQTAKDLIVNGNPTLRDAALLDRTGEPFPATPTTLMEKVDQKASEKVELSRGTIWLLATVLVLLGVVFSYGSSLLGWVRDDESQRAKTATIQKDVEEMRKDMSALKEQFTELEKILHAQAVKDAEKRGYELKAAEGDHGGK